MLRIVLEVLGGGIQSHRTHDEALLLGVNDGLQVGGVGDAGLQHVLQVLYPVLKRLVPVL